jgi:hypothetical protein
MNNQTEFNLAKLRVSVALLGESKGWWDTLFFDSNSDTFLDYIFPRSKNANQISACDVVQKIIDQKVGANHYHLFRLSINHEEKIHALLKKNKITIQTEDHALQTLIDISEGLSVDKAPGPKNIGSIDQIDENTIQALAAEYLSAFQNEYETYPYLN